MSYTAERLLLLLLLGVEGVEVREDEALFELSEEGAEVNPLEELISDLFSEAR